MIEGYMSIQPTIHSHLSSQIYGIPGIWAAPSIAGVHATRSPANSSPFGMFWLGQSGSSNTPALMITVPGKDSPVRKRVVPQSGQKWEVIFFPVSAILEISLGLPTILLE